MTQQFQDQGGAATMDPKLLARYDVELDCHLVEGPQGKNVPEPELLLQLSRYDAFHVAPEYGLEFPEHQQEPAPGLVQQASSILAASPLKSMPPCAAPTQR